MLREDGLANHEHDGLDRFCILSHVPIPVRLCLIGVACGRYDGALRGADIARCDLLQYAYGALDAILDNPRGVW